MKTKITSDLNNAKRDLNRARSEFLKADCLNDYKETTARYSEAHLKWVEALSKEIRDFYINESMEILSDDDKTVVRSELDYMIKRLQDLRGTID